ncbi:exodeoxyribonuclease VII large subunit [Pontixanthobacter aestiaquae]|uniref:Exodeoxyribonuclease 7 large subunit n=1 Tax=Pontixanthobacter aestiaquae TaxID=1509367 RepID=A0A844Z5U0_9SPHN|nr:exodeoxyribonuclease VII large subunit [Pontixanthobacter aestiaquae]MDN3646835.1 exodeoxyribonuclease VII large subunit [Pontixanthobacter aestiaquae]MXO82183.1 exodeoxyribonuclease VII large subunit [Pontixanthobacter aestiaquae]
MPSSSSQDSVENGLVARSGEGDNAAPLSITEISTILKRTVEDRFGHVRLRGELSGVKRAASGHLYCSLKDEKAVIDGVMWRGNAGRLGFLPEDGIEVVATGKLTTYAGRSKYQIVMDSMEIAGEGALLALLEKTRLRLEKEGLFAPERKTALPFLPRTIAVVTSPTGAVIRDILHRLADRFPSQVLVWPVLVQGQGSAEQVADAIRGFSDLPESVPKPDLLIVARGGGSIEDLWGFNEEVVVRAIADCPIPVISAVGHETDTTLADFAADRRAPTPTAAAEMAVPVRAELAATIEDLAHRKKRAIARPVTLGRERLDARIKRLPRPEALLQPQVQRLDDISERLRRGLKDRTAKGREKLGILRLSTATMTRNLRDAGQKLSANRLTHALVENRVARDSERFTALERLFQSLNPEAPLRRGFVLVKDVEGNLVRTKAAAEKHAQLGVKFADGVLDVATGTAPSAPAKPKTRKPRTDAAQDRQDDLFG